MILIENPFPLFTDNNGQPLESGYIYIGTAGLNAEVNQINVFWDKDSLYPAAQPIRTTNGLPVRGGTPSPLYTASTEYSILVKDKKQAFIYSASYYPTEVVPAAGSVTGPSIDDTAAFIFPTLLSLQKGADIAPALGILTLGIDGNYFDVTGTGPITSIASIGIGTQAKLQFDAGLVFTYDAANLILEGGVSITTKAGDHAYLFEYDTGKWRVNYIRASGLPIATIDEDDMVSDSVDFVPTQQSVKAYVDSRTVLTKIIDIGDWDMVATLSATVAHGLTLANIRSVDIIIRDDSDTQYLSYDHEGVANTKNGASYVADVTNVTISRNASQIFDSTNFDSTSYNRGWVTIAYII